MAHKPIRGDCIVTVRIPEAVINLLEHERFNLMRSRGTGKEVSRSEVVRVAIWHYLDYLKAKRRKEKKANGKA